MEGDPEFLPSAEVQMDLKQQAKKALAGGLQLSSADCGLPALHMCQHQQDRHVMPHQGWGWHLRQQLDNQEVDNVLSVTGFACHAEAAAKPKITPLMQFLHDKHSLKPEKKTVVVPVKKVTAVNI